MRLIVNQLLRNTEEGDQLNEDLVFKIEVKPTSSSTWAAVPTNVGITNSLPGRRNRWESLEEYIQRRFDESDGTILHNIFSALVFQNEYPSLTQGPIDTSLGVEAYSRNIRVYGRTQSPITKEIRIPVTRLDSDTYDIRVTKISAESTNFSIRELTWSSFEQITIEERSFPNTAMAQLIVKASNQLSSIPTVYGIYDTLEILVPDIFDPETRSYNFNGRPWGVHSKKHSQTILHGLYMILYIMMFMGLLLIIP